MVVCAYVEGVDAISPDVISKLTAPYFPSCRYLKSASLDNGEKLGIRGNFSIPSSCYIESTGHFNAVEFLICFNQLSYVLFGEAVEREIVTDLRAKTLEEFAEFQLEKVFIARSNMSFRKPIDVVDFNGSVYITRKKKIKGSAFYNLESEFSDSNGGRANGEFKVVMV